MAGQNGFNPAAIPFGASSPDQALPTWLVRTTGRGMTLIVAGKSGAGKSTLVKNLLRLKGKEGAPIIKHSPSSVTEKVQVYEDNVEDVPIRIVDMPGLEAPDQNEEDIITQLKEETNGGKADMLLYCASMAPCSKFSTIDGAILQLLTSTFKEKIWERTILVLTYADYAKNEIETTGATEDEVTGEEKPMKEEDINRAMEKKVNEYAKGFEKILATVVNSKQFSVHPLDSGDSNSPRQPFQIAAIPTTKKLKEKVQYQFSWDEYIYLEVLRKCNQEAIPSFLTPSRPIPAKNILLLAGVFAGMVIVANIVGRATHGNGSGGAPRSLEEVTKVAKTAATTASKAVTTTASKAAATTASKAAEERPRFFRERYLP